MLQILKNLNYQFEKLDGTIIQYSIEDIEKNIPHGVLLYVLAKQKG